MLHDYDTFLNISLPNTRQLTFPKAGPNTQIVSSRVIYKDSTDDPTPFVIVGGDKVLSHYAGKNSEDINAFFFKLRIFINHPSVDNCHLHPKKNILKLQTLQTSLCYFGRVPIRRSVTFILAEHLV